MKSMPCICIDCMNVFYLFLTSRICVFERWHLNKMWMREAIWSRTSFLSCIQQMEMIHLFYIDNSKFVINEEETSYGNFDLVVFSHTIIYLCHLLSIRKWKEMISFASLSNLPNSYFFYFIYLKKTLSHRTIISSEMPLSAPWINYVVGHVYNF